MTDVFLKDEGDFFTIGFQTDNAKKIVSKENDAFKELYGKDVPKLDVINKSKPMIISWLISHNLSWEEC
jgi:hypothetical protein